MQPVFDVSPSIALVDEKIRVKAHKLEPRQKVTISAKLCSERRERFESYGYFIADGNGDIDLENGASLGGTYNGVDGMGLFWSMKPAPGQRDGLRFMVRNVEKPMEVIITMFGGHIQPTGPGTGTPGTTVKGTGYRLAEAVVKRTYLAENVERIPVAAGRLRGTLFIPKDGRHYQGIIDLSGSIGGLPEFRAALLASRGFACLALAYFAYQDLPEHLTDVDVEYFLEAAEWLSKHTNVLPGGIGVIGTSFGAQIALLMASYSSCITAAVSVSGPSVIVEPSITYRGENLTPLPVYFENMYEYDDALVYTDCYGLVSEFPDNCFIPVENARGRIMMICGEDDHCLPATEIAFALQKRLSGLNSDSKLTILTYRGAGHLIEPPYMPLCTVSFSAIFGMLQFWGGRPAEHNSAQSHCWNAIINFFKENIKTKLDNKL